MVRAIILIIIIVLLTSLIILSLGDIIVASTPPSQWQLISNWHFIPFWHFIVVIIIQSIINLFLFFFRSISIMEFYI